MYDTQTNTKWVRM